MSPSESDSEPSDSPRKKERNPFTHYEITLLTDLIEKNLKTVESKETDFGNKEKKQDVWKVISKEFNSDVNTLNRKADQLRKKWQNIKFTAKKESAKKKRRSRKTGGGKQPPPLSTLTQRIIGLIPQQMRSLDNPYDCDETVADTPVDEEMPSVHVPETGCTQPEVVSVDQEIFTFEIRSDEQIATSSHVHSKQAKADINTTARTKNALKDPRSRIIDWEYEEHKIRLLTAKTTLQIEEERLKSAKNQTAHEIDQHEIKMKLLEAELVNVTHKNPSFP